MWGFGYVSNITTESNWRSFSDGSLVFGNYGNSQKLITLKNNCHTIVIADLIFSEGLSFNIAQKPRFKKIMELSRNVSKTYIPPNIKLIYKELLDGIHEKNMKSNLEIIKRGADIFGLLFLGDGATISICMLLNILDSGGNIPGAVL